MSHCPYCESPRIRWYYIVGRESVRHCLNCDLLFREKTYSEKNISDYYRKDYYRDWEQDQDDSQRVPIYLDALRFIETNTNKGILLDVGAGCGGLLSIARDRGWRIEGQEISFESCRKAKQKYGVELICDDIRNMDWEVNRFDAITMVNVLDHLPNPWWVLRKAFSALKKDGVIYMRVPNGNLHSRLYRISHAIPIKSVRERVRELMVIHLYHFSPRFFKKVLKDSGFGTVRICGSKVTYSSRSTSLDGPKLSQLLIRRKFSILSGMLYRLTGGSARFSPSIDVYAFKDWHQR